LNGFVLDDGASGGWRAPESVFPQADAALLPVPGPLDEKSHSAYRCVRSERFTLYFSTAASRKADTLDGPPWRRSPVCVALPCRWREWFDRSPLKIVQLISDRTNLLAGPLLVLLVEQTEQPTHNPNKKTFLVEGCVEPVPSVPLCPPTKAVPAQRAIATTTRAAAWDRPRGYDRGVVWTWRSLERGSGRDRDESRWHPSEG